MSVAGLGATTDLTIRPELLRRIAAVHAGDPEAMVIEELGLSQGSVRVDVAVLGPLWHGYEIKSDRDNLARLQKQAKAYAKCFDRVTVVSGCRHLDSVVASVPPWWGVDRAVDQGGSVVLEPVRPATLNPKVDPTTVARLLWREEILAILKVLGKAGGKSGATKYRLSKHLGSALSLPDLRRVVRGQFRLRGDWRGKRRYRSEVSREAVRDGLAWLTGPN